MIKLNDYLYDDDTVLKIIYRYASDLRQDANKTGNEVDFLHCDFLDQLANLLQHNDFLTAQSQKLRDFYMYLADEYPSLAFTFKGRIKSLIRAEEKFNGYVVETIYDYYQEHHSFPSNDELSLKLSRFRDLIAYRIVISVPQCHISTNDNRKEIEEKYLYEIANTLVPFMEKRGFVVEPSSFNKKVSPLLSETNQKYYRDYILQPNQNGYQALHITLFDTSSNSYIEVQLRTKDMDDLAEIGVANHHDYELQQEQSRLQRSFIPLHENIYFDEAYERGKALHSLSLSDVKVNFFKAMNNSLMNDGCGLYRGRLILPYEHLSRFQV